MLKRWLTLLGTLLLSLALAVPAFAAQAPIKVLVDGTPISFSAGSPYLQSNTVMVPFRAVFESLGLKVGWDPSTKSVTGTSADLTIKLTVGSSRATVGNIISKLPVAPVQQGGTVYVPLRFIGEATGGEVVWDASARSVRITKPEDGTGANEQINAVITGLNSAYNSENAAGVTSLAEPGSDYASTLADLDALFKYYDVKYTLNSVNILSVTDSEATVATVETSVRTGGYYLPDWKDEYVYTLVRDGYAWKISKVQSRNSTILLTREQGMTSVTLPQLDSTLIQNTLDLHYQNLNSENASGVMDTLASYSEEDYNETLDSLQKNFNSYDLAYKVKSSNIFYYNNDEAAVYIEEQITDKSDSSTTDLSLILVLDKYDDNQWIIQTSYIVSD